MSELKPITPDEFDWVSARAQCTPFTVFQKLRAQVQGDMNKRNKLTIEGDGGITFSFQSGPEWFSVAYKAGQMFKGIAFTRSANGIKVSEAASLSPIYDGILTISNEGRCKLRVDSVELDLWQFRKLALQDLFFMVEG